MVPRDGRSMLSFGDDYPDDVTVIRFIELNAKFYEYQLHQFFRVSMCVYV